MLGEVIEQRRAVEVPAGAVHEADGIERVLRIGAGWSLIDAVEPDAIASLGVDKIDDHGAASCERWLRKA